MELQVGVKAVLKNSDGKILLLKRSASKYPDIKEDKWDIVGGRINPGMSLLENLKREIKEEANLELVGEPVLMAAQDILKTPGRHVVRLTYIAEAAGEVKLNEEHDEYGWLDKKALNELGDGVDVYFKELLDRKIIDL